MNEVANTVNMCDNRPTELDTASVREIPENGYKTSENCKCRSNQEQSDVCIVLVYELGPYRSDEQSKQIHRRHSRVNRVLQGKSITISDRN